MMMKEKDFQQGGLLVALKARCYLRALFDGNLRESKKSPANAYENFTEIPRS